MEQRFAFGKNWQSFLSSLDSDRIKEAENSLRYFLKVQDLKGKSFLDIGSGSGLFSLAARNLGAQVFSFDYDPDSVACTNYLKNKFHADAEDWTVCRGSILDKNFLNELPKFDIIYSWGVLHHTGSMWEALDNSLIPAKTDSTIFIAIYNDGGVKSKIWLKVKKAYNGSLLGKIFVCVTFVPYFFLRTAIAQIARGGSPFLIFSRYKKERGMSLLHDVLDWIGGLPFEVASNEQIVDFFSNRNFQLLKIRTTNSHGCNQFVFKRFP